MSDQDYWIIDGETVPIVIMPRLEENVNDDVYCTRCNRSFIRKPEFKKGTAQYYRCSDCLSLKTTIKDFLYSCVVM
tara:strand:- start:354 stop:581 length:228 start_codon:yes stop_codon:yes gene_type:complete